MERSRPFLLGLAGGSASGKSTLAAAMAQEARNGELQCLAIDRFYGEASTIPRDQNGHRNFDHPAAIDWPLCRGCVQQLAGGETTSVPNYDFVTHARQGTCEIVAAPIIILEGLFTLYDAEIRRLLDHSVFLVTPHDVRYQRRLARDIKHRGRTPESVREQWDSTVERMYQEFVIPTKTHASEVVEVEPLDALTERLMRLARAKAG